MTPNRFYTVVVATNDGSRGIQFTLSRAWFKASVFLTFTGLLLVCTASVDYSRLTHSLRENRELLTENRALKEKRLVLEKNLSSIQTELSRVQVLTRKLKLIAHAGDPQAQAPVAVDSDRDPASLPYLGEDSAAEEVGGPVVVPTVNLMAKHEMDLIGQPLPVRVEKALQESQLREQELMNTWGLLSDRQSLLSATPSIKPTHGYYSSPFGYRYHPITGRPLLHAGVDIAAPWGSQVLAPADGVVTFAGYDGGYGNLVAIDHGYGVTTRFGHNSKLFVHAGQRVKRWEVISLVGSTGHSTGAHVHYEVRLHGLPTDPLNYILQEN